MEDEQLETIRTLGAQGRTFRELWDTYSESAFFIHGHLCGGMPLGFRIGVAALKALGAERELNMEKLAFVETGTGHAAGCFADGVQMATGGTFGKGLLERTQCGKRACALVDRATGKAVRVSVRPDVTQDSFPSPFVQQLRAGVRPTDISVDMSKPLVERLLGRSDAELLTVSEVFDYPLPKKPQNTFNLVVCAHCGETVAENKGRMKGGKPVCIPCSGYDG